MVKLLQNRILKRLVDYDLSDPLDLKRCLKKCWYLVPTTGSLQHGVETLGVESGGSSVILHTAFIGSRSWWDEMSGSVLGESSLARLASQTPSFS